MRIADAVFWKIMMIDGRAEQTEADREHAGDAAGAERDLERGRERTGVGAAAVRTLPRTARLMPMKPVRPERKRRRRTRACGTSPDCAEVRPDGVRRRRLHDLGRRHEHDDGDRDEDDRDRLELPPEVRHRAFLDRLGDLDHLRRALIGGEHAADQEEPDEERDDRGRGGEDEPDPLAVETEDLVAALGREDDHGVCSSGMGCACDLVRWQPRSDARRGAARER